MWAANWTNNYWPVGYFPDGGAAGDPAPVGGGGSRLLPLVGVGSSLLLGAVFGWQALAAFLKGG